MEFIRTIFRIILQGQSLGDLYYLARRDINICFYSNTGQTHMRLFLTNEGLLGERIILGIGDIYYRQFRNVGITSNTNITTGEADQIATVAQVLQSLYDLQCGMHRFVPSPYSTSASSGSISV